MNLPNKITVARIILTPLFFISFFLPVWFSENLGVLSAVLMLVLWALIEISDLADGIIARKHNLVTDLGKVMDPFSDTLARLTYFVSLVAVDVMPVWAFIIIMYREFSIVFLRMLMMKTGKAVAANIWGKTKAVMYAVSGIAGIFYVSADRLIRTASWKSMADPVLLALFTVTALASLISFFTYVSAMKRSGALSTLSR
ncbi:MAG: CDP-diacylglycerol--glycerol-3-phosphate 3-phosphatidyltransferase [Sphaerochaetaceae bacterium]|nr:CDP-diacylglycerol--glycerol-3-phosphate 3-phosphatidyltransferase [Sphaerochaetaceae bacterium]